MLITMGAAAAYDMKGMYGGLCLRVCVCVWWANAWRRIVLFSKECYKWFGMLITMGETVAYVMDGILMELGIALSPHQAWSCNCLLEAASSMCTKVCMKTVLFSGYAHHHGWSSCSCRSGM